MANRIDFQIGYKVDQSSLNTVKNSLKALQDEANKAKIGGTLSKELEQAADSAKKLQSILDQSWNSKLGELNLSKLNNSITDTYGSVEKMRSSFVSSGDAGANAYNQVASALLNTNLQAKNTSKILDDMAITLKNTVRFSLASSVVNNLSGAIEKAWSYSKNLNTSLNDIRIVTGDSADQMERFAKTANDTAKALGSSTLDYTKTAVQYYQQGGQKIYTC